jgi:hypothetical protein
MAISPGQYSFPLQRRADHELLLQFKDSTNAAINLNSSAWATIWMASRSLPPHKHTGAQA